jgi:ceramide glucosyltransferase
VLVALRTAPLRYCFGATMAVRRNALTAIGGIEALASYLADDHMLGRLVAAKGHKVALCPHIVEITVAEEDLRALFRHELRWARTMRTVRPIGYASSFVTDILPLALLGGLLTGSQSVIFGAVGSALLLRLLLHFVARAKLGSSGAPQPWLVPIRDLLTFAVRAASFIGRDVEWRASKFLVHPDGQMIVRN